MQDYDFEVVEHTADWSLRVRGADLTALMTSAAYGMGTLLVSNLEDIATNEARHVVVDGFDRESVLVEWLSELAYLAERDGLVFREFEVHEMSPELASITARGGHAPQLNKHIKAVTYHNLEVRETAGGLEVEIVFDV